MHREQVFLQVCNPLPLNCTPRKRCRSSRVFQGISFNVLSEHDINARIYVAIPLECDQGVAPAFV